MPSKRPNNTEAGDSNKRHAPSRSPSRSPSHSPSRSPSPDPPNHEKDEQSFDSTGSRRSVLTGDQADQIVEYCRKCITTSNATLGIKRLNNDVVNKNRDVIVTSNSIAKIFKPDWVFIRPIEREDSHRDYVDDDEDITDDEDGIPKCIKKQVEVLQGLGVELYLTLDANVTVREAMSATGSVGIQEFIDLCDKTTDFSRFLVMVTCIARNQSLKNTNQETRSNKWMKLRTICGSVAPLAFFRYPDLINMTNAQLELLKKWIKTNKSDLPMASDEKRQSFKDLIAAFRNNDERGFHNALRELDS